jgi:hypothetical protein
MITTTGVPAAALSESGTLPSGVTFVDNLNGTATLSGTPAAGSAGSYTLTLTASNGTSPNAIQSFTLTVNQASPQAPAFTSGNATTFNVGSAGSFTITTTGNPTASITESGALPSGVTFIDNGNGTATLSGTPAVGTSGVYTLSLTASNGIAPDATQSFSLTVNQAGQAPTFTSVAAATFTTGTAGSLTITTTGNPTPSITESGALPGGVAFTNNGNGTATLSGTPAAGSGGTYILTLTANNGVAPNATQTFTLTVKQAPAFTSANNTTFMVGSAGSFTITTSGFPAPSLSESGALPSGVTLVNNRDGTAILQGTPAAGSAGTYHLTFTATNVVGKVMQSFTLTVTNSGAAAFTAGTVDALPLATSGSPSSTVIPTTRIDPDTSTGTLKGVDPRIFGVPTPHAGAFAETLDVLFRSDPVFHANIAFDEAGVLDAKVLDCFFQQDGLTMARS